jgi:hypothetical protein
MATNSILQFGATSANILTDAAYAADVQRPSGVQPGIARDTLHNKTMKQVSLVAAAVAQFVADRQVTNIDDTLTPAQLAGLLKTSFGLGVTTINAANSPFTLTADHAGLVILDATAGNIVANLPAVSATLPLRFSFVRMDATGNTATVNRNGTDIIDGVATSFVVSPGYDYDTIASAGIVTAVGRWVTVAQKPVDGKTLLPSIIFAPNTPANGLTFTVNPGVWDFRNAALTSGLPVLGSLTAPASVVLPSGATLGTVNAVPSQIVGLLLLPPGLPPEPALINLAGGTDLSEQGLISSAAISAASNSASVVYSTVARASVPYRRMGALLSTQAVAGTWAAGATSVIGSAMYNAGFAQTPQNLIASRALGVTYQNSTPNEIKIQVGADMSNPNSLINVTTGALSFAISAGSSAGYRTHGSFTVPPYFSYSVSAASGTLAIWIEYR